MVADKNFLDNNTLHALFDDENSDEEKNQQQISQQGLAGM